MFDIMHNLTVFTADLSIFDDPALKPSAALYPFD